MRRPLEDLPKMIVEGRHVEVLTEVVTTLAECVQALNSETQRVDDTCEQNQSMSGHIRTLIDEVTKLQGRELYMCSDDVIWHRDGDRMYPLNDDGDHVDPDAWEHRGSIEVKRMRRPEQFPTFAQLESNNWRNVRGRVVKEPLKRVTELDVVKRHVRQLEARLSELEG